MPPPTPALSGQTVLVTGASSGIGAAFARELAKRGAGRIILVARRGDRLTDLARALGPSAVAHPADLTSPTEIARLCAAFPQVDLVINNAGFGLRGPLATLPPERLAAMVDLNCRAVVSLSRAWLPHMIAQRHGGIIHVGSIVGFFPVPTSAVYAASKAFVHSFSEALRAEVRPHGIRVHLVAPGPVPTEFFEQARGRPRTRPSPVAVAPETIARHALDDLDADVPRRVPGLPIRLASLAASIVPLPVLRALMARIAAQERQVP